MQAIGKDKKEDKLFEDVQDSLQKIVNAISSNSDKRTYILFVQVLNAEGDWMIDLPDSFTAPSVDMAIDMVDYSNGNGYSEVVENKILYDYQNELANNKHNIRLIGSYWNMCVFVLDLDKDLFAKNSNDFDFMSDKSKMIREIIRTKIGSHSDKPLLKPQTKDEKFHFLWVALTLEELLLSLIGGIPKSLPVPLEVIGQSGGSSFTGQ